MTKQERELLIALQCGAPEVIGYGPERQGAFRHGWNEAMERVYTALLLSSPSMAAEIAGRVAHGLGEREGVAE